MTSYRAFNPRSEQVLNDAKLVGETVFSLDEVEALIGDFRALDSYYTRSVFPNENPDMFAIEQEKGLYLNVNQLSGKQERLRRMLSSILIAGGVNYEGIREANGRAAPVDMKRYILVRQLYARSNPNGPAFFSAYYEALAAAKVQLATQAAPEMYAPVRRVPPPPPIPVPRRPSISLGEQAAVDLHVVDGDGEMVITNRNNFSKRVPIGQFLSSMAALRQFNREYGGAVQHAELDGAFIADASRAQGDRSRVSFESANSTQVSAWVQTGLGQLLEANDRLYQPRERSKLEQVRRAQWLRTETGKQYEKYPRSKQSYKNALNLHREAVRSVMGLKVNFARQ